MRALRNLATNRTVRASPRNNTTARERSRPRRPRPRLLSWVNMACVTLTFSLGLVASPANAAGPWDPDTRWRMISTPHFHIVFPRAYEAIGRRTARIGERLWPFMATRYRWKPPGRITVVLDDQTDFANGSARVLPNRIITIFLTAPIRTTGLEAYDDWLYTVLSHEMAHVFHLDMAYGLAGIGRILLGQYVSMNSYAAAWSTEGLAVYEETMTSGAGRGRSTYVDMVLRMAALEGRFPSVDQAYRAFPRWPFGNVVYFFGGRFHRWLAERFGEDTMLDYHRGYAADPIPYLTFIPAKAHFDASIESLWAGFAEESKEAAEAVRQNIERHRPPNLLEPRRLSFLGGESVGPRITPDGASIVFSASSPVDGPRVRIMDLDGQSERVLLNDTLSQAVGFTPDGSAFYFQQTEINQRFYRHNQLLRYDLDEDRVDYVTLAPGFEEFLAPSGALRARDPDVSPDGSHLVFVQTPRATNRLVIAALDEDGVSIRPTVSIPGGPDVQFASPRFSPDGKWIAVSRFEGGRRDIVLYTASGELHSFVTRDRAQDVDPTWSSDGRWLVFSSDRSRVYDLYGYDLHTERLHRLTHLVSGAFQPSISPDGNTLVFRGYTAEGFDVFRLPFRPAAAPVVNRGLEPPLRLDAQPRSHPPRHGDAPPPPPPATDPMFSEGQLPEGWKRSGYSPLPTLLPNGSNWNLLPGFAASEREVLLSLTHFGQDALQTQTYALTVRYGTFSEFLGGTVTYAYDGLEPTFTLSANADAVTFSRTNFVDARRPEGCGFGGLAQTMDGTPVCFGTEGGLYVERRLSASFFIGLPLRQRHLLSVGYTFEDRAPLRKLPSGSIQDILPLAGRYARVTLGYSYANVRRFPYSVSSERGPAFSAALSALSGGLGSDFEQIVATVDGRYYWDLPWADNHVLAVRAAVGLGGGPDLAERFRLGGVTGISALSVTTQNLFPLRGLSPALLTGTGQLSGTLEYRAPLFRVDRGLGTFPIGLSVVHAAVFLDGGRTFDNLEAFGQPGFGDAVAASAGAELRADVLLAFVAPLTFRFGAAWPFKLPQGALQGRDTQEFFFQLGSAF